MTTTTDIIEVVRPAAIIAAGTTTTWLTREHISAWVTVFVGVLTAVYIIIQIFHLLRTWYMKEEMYARTKRISDFMKLSDK